MDDIGLGNFLIQFGYVCGVVFFVLVLLLAKYLIRVNALSSLILATFAGFLGYFASPYLFYILFSLLGYSF